MEKYKKNDINILFSSEYATKLVIDALKKELQIHPNKIKSILNKIMEGYIPPITKIEQPGTITIKGKERIKVRRKNTVVVVKTSKDKPKQNFSVYSGT